ncbi:MAG TPA: hypothetical protein VIH90_05730 [Candidatus Saccharimonadales bacterium]
MIEVDGVRRRLERPITQAGDLISDEWLKAIDLTTHPDSNSPLILSGLASAIRRLNRNLATTSLILEGTEFEDTYNGVIDQINCLNSARDVGELLPLMSGVTWSQYSGLFKFADSQY